MRRSVHFTLDEELAEKYPSLGVQLNKLESCQKANQRSLAKMKDKISETVPKQTCYLSTSATSGTGRLVIPINGVLENIAVWVLGPEKRVNIDILSSDKTSRNFVFPEVDKMVWVPLTVRKGDVVGIRTDADGEFCATVTIWKEA